MKTPKNQKTKDEDRLLSLIESNPKASQAELATGMCWKLYSGDPHKTRVARCIKQLEIAKLIKPVRGGGYTVTNEGKDVLKNSPISPVR